MNLYDMIVYLTAVLICYKIRVYISILWHYKTDKRDAKQTNESDIDVVIFVPNDNAKQNDDESKDKDPLNQLMSFIGSTEKTIDICVYGLSANQVIKKCIELHRRGVKVRVITNDFSDKRDKLCYAYLMTKNTDERMYQKKSQADLQKSGIDIRYFKMGLGYMHNKFAIIDRKILMNGSFNWTKLSQRYNYEDLVITNDKQLVDCYATKFDEYWQKLEDPNVAWTFPDNFRNRKKSY